MAELQLPTYDIVIFGASGFTGKYVIREALKFLNTPNSSLKTLALAGRNPSKLSDAPKWASGSTSHPAIPFLIADTADPPSLRRMASQAKLILNCVGPFRHYGDPVVAACVEMGCDYLDICGEPEFMERMEAVYHEKAVEKGSLVVSACGFDSVPAEFGLMFYSRQWVSPAVPNRVEAYLSLESDKRIEMVVRVEMVVAVQVAVTGDGGGGGRRWWWRVEMVVAGGDGGGGGRRRWWRWPEVMAVSGSGGGRRYGFQKWQNRSLNFHVIMPRQLNLPRGTKKLTSLGV